MTEIFILAMLIAAGIHLLNAKDQKRRMTLLGGHLREYQIEKLMESLTGGYLRALGEDDPERRTQIWNLLGSTELELNAQFNRFAAAFLTVDAADALTSKYALPIPYAAQLFPLATFDMREALLIHARGITQAVNNSENKSPKSKAYTLTAELFLMQHSCHWFCKSKAIASARVLARHQTTYAQVLASVAPETRKAYSALVGR